MTPFARSTVADAAEHAMRAQLVNCDQPLRRLESLARDLFLAFRDASGGRPETTALAEVAAGFRIAVERLWAEFGGDPGCVPDIAFSIDGTPDQTPWPNQLPQQ